MQTPLQPKDYAEAIATLVGKMSLERAAQVHEFVRFLQSQPTYPPPIVSDNEELDDERLDDESLNNEAWLHDSEEQMQAEDALWEAALTRNQDEFTALEEAARKEIANY